MFVLFVILFSVSLHPFCQFLFNITQKPDVFIIHLTNFCVFYFFFNMCNFFIVLPLFFITVDGCVTVDICECSSPMCLSIFSKKETEFSKESAKFTFHVCLIYSFIQKDWKEEISNSSVEFSFCVKELEQIVDKLAHVCCFFIILATILYQCNVTRWTSRV